MNYGFTGQEGHLTNAIVLNRDNYREMDDNERSREGMNWLAGWLSDFIYLFIYYL